MVSAANAINFDKLSVEFTRDIARVAGVIAEPTSSQSNPLPDIPYSRIEYPQGGNTKKLPRRQLLHLGATALGILFIVVSSHTARSQTARSIRIIVPFPPGGAANLLARVLADQVGRAQATTVAVENRSGAGLVVGTDAAARAAPDGIRSCLIRKRRSLIRTSAR